MQQQSIRTLAMRAQERIRGNRPCNKRATGADKACNNDDSEKLHLLHRKLHLSAAEMVLDVAHELDLSYSRALGFFNSLDWRLIALGKYGSEAVHLALTEIAKQQYERDRLDAMPSRLVEE